MEYDGVKIKQWAGNSQWRAWLADLARFKAHGYSGWGSEGFWALTLYRLQRAIYLKKNNIWIVPWILVLLLKKIFTVITHINLNYQAKIGPGLLIPHVGSIQVYPYATIGADCVIHQITTIGSGSEIGGPVIGDHVYIGAHVCILGPVRIGDEAKIGAGAVVVTDIPSKSTAVGVPAKCKRT